MVDRDWREDAACRGIGHDVFFPDVGDSVRDVKRICVSCPVIAECLDWAVSVPEPHGVWGGLSLRERRPLNAARRVAAVGEAA